MHTTEEAKLLWCPMVRVAWSESPGFGLEPTIVSGVNTDAMSGLRIPENTHCVADRCAMWRWDGAVKLPEKREADTIWPDEDEPRTEPKREVTLKGKVTPVPDWAVWVPIAGEGDDLSGGYWVEPQERVDAEHDQAVVQARAAMRGYCGLAGRLIDKFNKDN